VACTPHTYDFRDPPLRERIAFELGVDGLDGLAERPAIGRLRGGERDVASLAERRDSDLLVALDPY
jgi:hypothetical protein